MGNQLVFAVNISAELQNVKSFTRTRISKPDFTRIYPSYPRHFATLHIWLQVQEVSSVADNMQLLIMYDWHLCQSTAVLERRPQELDIINMMIFQIMPLRVILLSPNNIISIFLFGFANSVFAGQTLNTNDGNSNDCDGDYRNIHWLYGNMYID